MSTGDGHSNSTTHFAPYLFEQLFVAIAEGLSNHLQGLERLWMPVVEGVEYQRHDLIVSHHMMLGILVHRQKVVYQLLLYIAKLIPLVPKLPYVRWVYIVQACYGVLLLHHEWPCIGIEICTTTLDLRCLLH